MRLTKLKPKRKSLNRLNTNIINVKRGTNMIKKGVISEELKTAFDKIEGCIVFDGNGADLAKEIRKNGFIKLKGA